MTTQRYLHDALKQIEIQKRDRKTDAAKRKEREETERKYLRNLERIEKSD